MTPYVGTIGNIGIHSRPGKYHLGSNVGKIELYNDDVVLLEEYVVSYLQSGFGYQQLTKHMKATAQASISIEAIRDVYLPVPPANEQIRMWSALSDALNLIDTIEKTECDIGDLIKATKSKILDLAIRGKLVPQNPEDEPAAILLDRIRAEKEELIKSGKIKRNKKESVIFKGDDNSYYEKIGNVVDCINDEIPFEIPETWVWSRLGSLGNWGAGATPSRNIPEYYKGNIPWLKTGDLNDGYITYIPENISELALTNTSVRLNPKGSVLIAMYGATIGKLGILTFPATTNQACCACIPFAGIENRYLFYYLLSQRENFIYRGVGGAQPNISKEKIVSTLIPLPPQNEQLKIIEKIDRLFNLLSTVEQSLS